MKTNEYTLSQIAMNEMKEFALYTINARAIPNLLDGMKPVQRFYLYSSLQESKKEFEKVSAVAGVISKYGYNHGEVSAEGAGKLMAAEWNNNICLIEGQGGFGSRQIQEAGASRYVKTRVHENFFQYVKDIDLAPEHVDPEHQPPSFYIPVIPLVLANGVKGIATAFATNILPRDPKDIARACEEYVKTGKISKKVKVKFPHFRGNVEYDATESRYYCYGIYEKPSDTKMIIREIPYGFDRESYIKVLDKLEEKGEVTSYEEQSDKSGFLFEVKLKRNSSAKWNRDRILKEFKLVKTHVENLTVIDWNDTLREYDDERELIKDFCEYRNEILDKRIKLRIQELTENSRWLKIKMQFIQAVLDGNILFKNKKKSDVTKQIFDNTEAIDDDIDPLLRISIVNLTDELVNELRNKIKEISETLKYWKSTTPKEQFLNDLKEMPT